VLLRYVEESRANAENLAGVRMDQIFVDAKEQSLAVVAAIFTDEGHQGLVPGKLA